MTRAAIYVRSGTDPTGAGREVARQEEACRALCERRGWTVAEVYSDNNLSSGAQRPGWERLLTDMEAGAVDAVAVWHVGRLTRSHADFEHLIDLIDRRGVVLAAATGEVDPSAAGRRVVAGVLGAKRKGSRTPNY